MYLLWKSITVDSEDTTLSGSEEVDRPWLLGVGGKVDLLGEVEAVVHRPWSRTWRIGTQLSCVVFDAGTCCGCLLSIRLPLDENAPEMMLMLLELLHLFLFRLVGGLVETTVVLLALPA
mgnify:CR=1 FL=1